MDPEFLAAFSWRGVLIGLVGLLVLYVAFAFLRMRRLRAQSDEPVSPPARADVAIAAYAAVAEEAPPPPPPPAPVAEEKPAATFAWNEPPPFEPADRRDVEAIGHESVRLRQELTALRERFAALDAEVVRLRRTVQDEFASLREELQRDLEQASVAQHVSPLYGEAMQMALGGASAQAISERCGIARAEAELVVALTRSREDGQQ